MTLQETSTPIAPTTSARRILLTGSAGGIGRSLWPALRARGHEVRGFDVRPTQGLEGAITASLTDPQAVRDAVRDVDTVLHLAATPNDLDFLTRLLPNNLQGAFQLLDEAAKAGVKRLILASTIQVVNGLLSEGRTVGVDEAKPDNHYGLTKLWLEHAGRIVHRKHGTSVLAVRIGACPTSARNARWTQSHEAEMDLYLSLPDAARFFIAAVEAPHVGYEIVYATSRPRGRPRVDLEPAARLLGYVPRDTYPENVPTE